MNTRPLDHERHQDARRQVEEALEAIELARRFPVAGGPVPIKETRWGGVAPSAPIPRR